MSGTNDAPATDATQAAPGAAAPADGSAAPALPDASLAPNPVAALTAQTDAPADPNAPASDAPPDDKPADPPRAPESYEFTPPEVDGKPLPFDEEGLAGFRDVAKAADLTQEQFAAVAKFAAERGAKINDAANSVWANTNRAWQEAVKADPQLGGANLDNTLAGVARAVDFLGGDADGAKQLRDVLDLTGFGNHPAAIRALSKLAAAIGEDGNLVTGKPAPVSKKTTGQLIYGANAAATA